MLDPVFILRSVVQNQTKCKVAEKVSPLLKHLSVSAVPGILGSSFHAWLFPLEVEFRSKISRHSEKMLFQSKALFGRNNTSYIAETMLSEAVST